MPLSPAETLARLVAEDPRADSGTREISIAPGAVVIDRRVGGVRMRLSVPAESFRGVSLTVREDAGSFCYRVALIHGDPELNVVLAELEREADAAAEWCAWAEFFGLPRLAQRPGGGIEAIESRFGLIAAGEVQPRRRGWPLKERRSAISGRRKVPASGPLPRRHDEREIISYE